MHALQLTLGLSADPVFGPVLWLGTRPCAAIPAGETAVGLPPLSPTLAESMLEAAQIRCAPESPGGLPPALYEALADALLHLSDLAVALPAVGTLQIQLACGSSGVAAMGAQARLDPERAPPDRHYRHMAIHPYPAGLEQQIRLADGTLLPVRPIRPEDAGIERAFVENLSDQSRYMRFFGPTRQLSARMLARLTQVDYDRELALIALSGPEPDCGMVGVARFSPLPDEGACEFALAVADAYQRRGLGKVLMQRLISAAREAGYRRMCGAILGTNTPMIALARRLGFTLQSDPQDMTVLQAERPLA
jgi:acetyltransferase